MEKLTVSMFVGVNGFLISFAFLLVINVVLVNCAVSDTKTFENGDTIYTIHFVVSSSQPQAQSTCKDSFESDLAMITTNSELDMINSNLQDMDMTGLVTPGYNEIWTGGKTGGSLHGLVNLNDPAHIPKDQGPNCVALSDYSDPGLNSSRKYNLFSKLCSESGERNILCAKKKSPVIEILLHMSTTYHFVLNKEASRAEAEEFCNQRFGAALVLVTDPLILLLLNLKLVNLKAQKQLNKAIDELWVGGKTDAAQHQLLDPSSDQIQTAGSMCLILSDWSGHKSESDTKFNMYSKQCDAVDRNFICALSNAPVGKYLYAESLGQCPGSTKISEASFYVSEAGCRDLSGRALTPATPEQLVLCQFDICSTDRADRIAGIVVSSEGNCPGTPAYLAYISALQGADCLKLGGRMAFFNELGGSQSRAQCILEVCRNTKAANYYTLVFSNQNTCSLNERSGSPDIFTDSDSSCSQINGEIIHEVQKNIYNKTRCQLQLCHIAPRGCKTSQTGREYTGDMSVTISGKTCQRWDSQTPHPHSHSNPVWFPESTIAEASNYCRNPADWGEGPFCFTTDPVVTWEICNIPFCPGSGPTPIDYQDGLKRFIYIPGQHSSPTDFCEKVYNAHPARITGPLGDGLTQWLTHLISPNHIHQKKIWVGGRSPSVGQRGIRITNYDDIEMHGDSGSCLVLSNWNGTTKAYNGDSMSLYTEACPQYYRQFLCEMEEMKINDYEVGGGVAQMEVHNIEDCRKSCQGACWAAGYNKLEETCWHYMDSSDCQPGRSNPHFLFYLKASCGCHDYLISMDTRVELSASSVAPSRGNHMYNVKQGKIGSKSLLTKEGLLVGAWVPAMSTLSQWIQAKFPKLRMIYGIVTLGMDGTDSKSFVRKYKLKTSSMSNCDQLVTYGGDTKYFDGNSETNTPATAILEQALMVYCVRLCPQTWSNTIALRFDVLGCSEQPSIALGKPVSSSSGQLTPSTERVVDGFTWGIESCVLTRVQSNPWLAVDLVEYYDIDEIVVYTPTRCCDGQLKQLSVSVLSVWINGPRVSTNEECGFIPDLIPMGQPQKVTCSPVKTGRHIVIQKKVSSDSLAACEIKVHGQKSKSQNLAVNKPTQQSSLMHNLGIPSHAVDGNLNNVYSPAHSCSHTHEERDPWWLVDLEDEFTITSVVIIGRADCCGFRIHDLFIYIGNDLGLQGHLGFQQLYASDPVAYEDNEFRHYSCVSPIIGRYIKVLLNTEKEYLTLCEVLVFGHPVLIQTYSGNTQSSVCSFPFMYNGTEYKKCITNERDGRFWCATTPDYDRDQLWGYCMDVKLGQGRLPSEGLVFVRSNSDFTWGTVCDDGWDDLDASVMCKALGYPGGKAAYPPYFGAGSGNISISDVGCVGSEDSPLACPHTNNPSHCGHHEDAAVICSDPDAVPLYGNPAIMRTQEDGSHEGIVVFPDSQAILMPGKLSAWKFHSLKNVTQLALQIWRRVLDLKGPRFILIGSMDVTRALNTEKEVHILDPDPVQVQTGDRIGFAFRGGNPIPYDHTFHCGTHGMIIFRPKATTNLGSIHSFTAKEDQNRGCRVYSLYAEVETSKLNVLKQFVYEGNLYRIFTSLQTRASAEAFCQSSLGQGSQVMALESTVEFLHIKEVLASMELRGSFWLGNSAQEVSDAADWAPCQPEQGKECLSISNNNKDGRYLWYSKNCDVAMYFICEVKKPETSTVLWKTNSVPALASSPSTFQVQIQPSKNKGYHNLPVIITVAVLVPAIVAALAVLLALYLRRRHRNHVNLTLVTSSHYLTESTCPLTPDDDNISVISQPQTGSVVMHKKSENMSEEMEGIENPIYD